MQSIRSIGVVGLWLLMTPASVLAGPDALLRDLMASGDFMAARREGMRLLAEDPGHVFATATLRQLEKPPPDGKTPPNPSVGGAWVSRLIVHGYRAQVRPAIASRCRLHPSCSEYFHLAGEKHGWWAIPMIADRLVREPHVLSKAEHVLYKGATAYVPDPVSDHDAWLPSRRRCVGDQP